MKINTRNLIQQFYARLKLYAKQTAVTLLLLIANYVYIT